MNEHAFFFPLKIGSILIPFANHEDQHLTFAINSADSFVGLAIWFCTSKINLSINPSSINFTSSKSAFCPIKPVFELLCTVISSAISDNML